MKKAPTSSVYWFLGGVAAAGIGLTLYRAFGKSREENPAVRAGQAFYQRMLDLGNSAIKLHSMRTVEAAKLRPYFGGWAVTVETPTDTTRAEAEAAAVLHDVKLLTYSADGGETYVFAA